MNKKQKINVRNKFNLRWCYQNRSVIKSWERSGSPSITMTSVQVKGNAKKLKINQFMRMSILMEYQINLHLSSYLRTSYCSLNMRANIIKY